MSRFGRKGLEAQPRPQQLGHGGQSGLDALRNSARGPFQPQPGNAGTSRKVDAFLASERQRSRETHASGGSGASEAGVSDFAAAYRDTTRPTRSLPMAYVLWFVLGQVSAHRFYLGAYRSAIAQVGLFAFWLILALSVPTGAQNTLGPVLAVAVIGWALWILADVFLIHRIHRKLCRGPGAAAAAFA